MERKILRIASDFFKSPLYEQEYKRINKMRTYKSRYDKDKLGAKGALSMFLDIGLIKKLEIDESKFNKK